MVGALLQLGNCLDLLDTDHTRRLAAFATQHVTGGATFPENDGAKRLADCALINDYCDRMERLGTPVHTVRGLFQEGEPVMRGSAILLENHIHIVARAPDAIVGLFKPREFVAWPPTVAPASPAVQDERP